MNLTVFRYGGDGVPSSIGSGQSNVTSGVILVTIPVAQGNITFFASVFQENTFIRSQWVDLSPREGLQTVLIYANEVTDFWASRAFLIAIYFIFLYNK